MIAAVLALFGEPLATLGALTAFVLAVLGAFKVHGAVQRHKGAAEEAAATTERMAAVDRETATHIAAARFDVAAADDAELDRLLDANATAARTLIVPGTARDRARHDRG